MGVNLTGLRSLKILKSGSHRSRDDCILNIYDQFFDRITYYFVLL